MTNLDEVETPLDDFTSCVLKKSIAFTPQLGSVSTANNNLLATILTGSINAEAAVSSGGCSQVQTNKVNGDAARDKRRELQFPNSQIEQVKETSLGKRIIDIETPNEIIEVKAGRKGLDSKTRIQIQKDILIPKNKKIWSFEKSPVTGKIGPNDSLFNHLIDKGFEVTVDGKVIKTIQELNLVRI